MKVNSMFKKSKSLAVRYLPTFCMIVALVISVVAALVGRACAVLAFVFAFAMATYQASAQTDIISTITTLTGYWTAISTLAIVIVLFVIGRALLRRVK